MKYISDNGYTQAYVAKILGVTRQAIKRRVNRGTLPSFLDSKGRRVVDKAWFDKYMAACGIYEQE